MDNKTIKNAKQNLKKNPRKYYYLSDGIINNCEK